MILLSALCTKTAIVDCGSYLVMVVARCCNALSNLCPIGDPSAEGACMLQNPAECCLHPCAGSSGCYPSWRLCCPTCSSG